MYLTGTFYYSGESLRCYIWRFNEQGEHSSLYIHKWRVPEPFPRAIEVSIRFEKDFYPEDTIKEIEVVKNSYLKNKEIVRKVYRNTYHGKTVRFDTLSGSDRPFDSIYIPKLFLKGKEEDKTVQVVIKWK